MPVTYPYTTTVPVASNFPSTDQPAMTQNTSSINSIIGTDHISFGLATGNQTDGYHNIIHFAAQGSDPGSIGTIGQIYSKNLTVNANTDQCLFFESGGGRITQLTGITTNVAGNQTNVALAPNGYTPLTGGLLLQWGEIASANNAGGTTTVTFATSNISFPTACFTVFVTLRQGASGSSLILPTATNITKLGFTMKTTPLRSDNYAWLAIGN